MARYKTIIALIWVLAVHRIAGDCSMSTISSLKYSDNAQLSSCFEIEEEEGWGNKLCTGNVIKIKPKDVYTAAYPNTTFKCTPSGWETSPKSCKDAVKATANESCLTDVFYNDKYKVNTYMTNVSGHDSDRPFTRVLEGAVVQYWARQPDCFEFVMVNRTDKMTAEGKLETTCTDGIFDPPVAVFTKTCCDYPTFKDNKDVPADFCVGIITSPVEDEGSTGAIVEHYVKSGAILDFDKKCPCFTFDLGTTTCLNGSYSQAVPTKVENRCCKVPHVPFNTGLPSNNVTDQYYVTWDSYVTFRCEETCYKIKDAMQYQKCRNTQDLDVPRCIRDPSCCFADNVTNPYFTDYNVTQWSYTRSGKRAEYSTAFGNATRRCRFSDWDLIKYNDVNINEDKLETTLGKISIQNCSELQRLAGVNLTRDQYETVVKQWIIYTRNISSKEKIPCYETMRYFLSDMGNNGFLKELNTTIKNDFIGAIRRTMRQWVTTIIHTIYIKTTYFVARVKKGVLYGEGVKSLFNYWQVELKGGDFAEQLLLVFIDNADLFPNTTHSSVISPVVFVDLPLNMTLQPGYTNDWNKVTVNFTSFDPLMERRHYSCAVYDPDEGLWKRDACENTTVHGQSVICGCSNWTRFIAVTQTFNHSPEYFGSFLVGDADTHVQIQTMNSLNIVAMVPLVVTFFLLVTATTKRKPLHQCRLQMVFCMVSTNLVGLLTYFLKPANISCVYMMYIFEIFAISTVLWFVAELAVICRYLKQRDDRDVEISKMYPFKCCIPIYLTALLIPTICLIVEKVSGDAGVYSFVEPFDAQSCWFNIDVEFFEFFIPVVVCMSAGCVMLIVAVVIFFMGEKTTKGDGLDVLASGLMLLLVTSAWIFQLFRGNDYLQMTGKILAAAQGVGSLILYVGLAEDIKQDLFPGCYPGEDGADDKKH